MWWVLHLIHCLTPLAHLDVLVLGSLICQVILRHICGVDHGLQGRHGAQAANAHRSRQ
jgi:hypothetical protein